jgi:hypothetical protein
MFTDNLIGGFLFLNSDFHKKWGNYTTFKRQLPVYHPSKLWITYYRIIINKLFRSFPQFPLWSRASDGGVFSVSRTQPSNGKCISLVLSAVPWHAAKAKLTAWKCNIIGWIILTVAPAVEGILELKLNPRLRVFVDISKPSRVSLKVQCTSKPSAFYIIAPPSRVLISQQRHPASGLIPSANHCCLFIFKHLPINEMLIKHSDFVIKQIGQEGVLKFV